MVILINIASRKNVKLRKPFFQCYKEYNLNKDENLHRFALSVRERETEILNEIKIDTTSS